MSEDDLKFEASLWKAAMACSLNQLHIAQQTLYFAASERLRAQAQELEQLRLKVTQLETKSANRR